MASHAQHRPRRALVIGGSMAGLVSSRVLADHFDEVVLVERDRFPTTPGDNRAGLPQGWHHHVLLSRGREILTSLFPDLDQRMDAEGIPLIDYGRDAALISRVGELKRFESGVMIRPCRRPTLDRLVVEALRKVTNITFQEQTRVESLTTETDANGTSKVTGIRGRVRNEHNETEAVELSADLVVDASGIRSSLPKWLDGLGYDVPDEEVVDADLGYASCLYEAPKNHVADWRVIGITTRPPHNPRAAGLWEVENGKWMCSLIGTAGHYPPSDEEGFLAFARGLPDPRIHAFIRDAKPLTKIRAYRGTKNRWRHYEEMKRFPSGLVALGTTMCSYNPLYGQGMTVVAEQALVLGRHAEQQLNRGKHFDERFAQSFHRAISRTVRLPWLLATLEDWRWPSTKGERPGAWMDISTAYVDRILPLATHDAFVAKIILDIMNMKANPAVLGRPSMVGRYLRSFVPTLKLSSASAQQI